MAAKINIEKVLVAPLDWGMGHATRCISLIQSLLHNGYKVLIAASEEQKIFLQQEFPDIEFAALKGYEVRYSKTGWLFLIKLFAQVPRVLSIIKYEHQWLNKIIDKQKIDLVISDNRFGLHSKKCNCIFITHQLTVKAPFDWLENVIQKINYSYINRFDACWIPDVAGNINAAGILSHPKKLPKIPVHYLGLLSRFEKHATAEKKYDYCIVLSGPEPQRTILEKLILKDIEHISGKILLVRGLPASEEIIQTSENVTIKNYLPGTQLQQAFQQSEYIISRSGYTTVMEILSIQKKSILIPTPGQTEQEYLADLFQNQNLAFTISQSKFSIINAVQQAKQFSYSSISLPVFNDERLKQLMQQLEF